MTGGGKPVETTQPDSLPTITLATSAFTLSRQMSTRNRTACATGDNVLELSENSRRDRRGPITPGGFMPKASTKAPSESDNRPVHEIRHRNIRATIWKNETAKGPMYNVTVSRSYRDDAGEWHDSNSFGFGDLMNLAKALYDAHSAIATAIARERAPRNADKASGAKRD